ncbi:MAG TPA: MAPEG family protein, partial [Polyangiales bacterium]
MDPIAIFRPVVALVGLTTVVLLRIPYVRFRAGRRRQVTFADFRLGESPQVPPEVALPNRNLMNLLEMPVLFYALTLTLLVTRRADVTAL